MIILMLGAPGAGKGTIGKRLAENLEVPYLASGDIFRNLIKEGTKIGKQIEQCINKGELIQDEVAKKIFEEEILHYDLEKGIILDGYPRTEIQAKSFDIFLKNVNSKIDMSINIDIKEELIVDRMINRRICSNCGAIYNLKYGKKVEVEGKCDKCGGNLIQRSDDNKKTVCDRLENYTKLTKPLLAYYQNKNILYNLHSDENTSVEQLLNVAMEYVKDVEVVK